ncbi:MAG: hypothetical protein ACK5XN_24900 [Bacteroidota bacterium]|jgi:hypothetical protein
MSLLYKKLVSLGSYHRFGWIIALCIGSQNIFAQEIFIKANVGFPMFRMEQAINKELVSDARLVNLQNGMNQPYYGISVTMAKRIFLSAGTGKWDYNLSFKFDSLYSRSSAVSKTFNRFNNYYFSAGYCTKSRDNQGSWLFSTTLNICDRVDEQYTWQNSRFSSQYITGAPFGYQQYFILTFAEGTKVRGATWFQAGFSIERRLRYTDRFRLSYSLNIQTGLNDFDNIRITESGRELTTVKLNILYPYIGFKAAYSLQGSGRILKKTWNKFTKWLII